MAQIHLPTAEAAWVKGWVLGRQKTGVSSDVPESLLWYYGYYTSLYLHIHDIIYIYIINVPSWNWRIVTQTGKPSTHWLTGWLNLKRFALQDEINRKMDCRICRHKTELPTVKSCSWRKGKSKNSPLVVLWDSKHHNSTAKTDCSLFYYISFQNMCLQYPSNQ